MAKEKKYIGESRFAAANTGVRLTEKAKAKAQELSLSSMPAMTNAGGETNLSGHAFGGKTHAARLACGGKIKPFGTSC